MTKRVSFIIPHKGREEMLRQTVESIFRLEADPQDIEVILVTQNESLACLPQLQQGDVDVHVLYPPSGITISALRNLGAEKAQGEYLAFLDADIELSPNWLTTMLKLLSEKPTRKLVSAMQVDGRDAPVLERIRTVLSNAELDCNVNFLPGRNLFLSKQTFTQVGGFPEHLVTCEDYYFTDKVHELGELYYSSEAQYVHLGEDKEYGHMYEKEVWRGQSNLQSIKGRRIPLREIPSFIVPPAMLMCLFLSIIAFLLQSGGYSLLFLIAALLPVFIYSQRLFQLADKKIPFSAIAKFYVIYFPARAKGTILGLVKSFSVKEVK